MTFDTFIENLESLYEGDYSKIELQEIRSLLYNFESEKVDILYDHIRDNYSYRKLPQYQYIKKACQQLRLEKKETKMSDEVYKKTPMYQLELARDWNAKAIIEHCQFIRKKQSQLWKDGKSTIDLPTEDVSFLSVWDRLCDVEERNLEIARNRMVENGEKELHYDTQVKLNDLMKPLIKVKGIENRKVVNEIPF